MQPMKLVLYYYFNPGGLITLADGVGINATINDIVDNPSITFKLKSFEAAVVPTVLADVDIACIKECKL